jgi:hypothetical protein
MPNRDTDRTAPTDRQEPIDASTSKSICRAIGDRLRQNLAPEASGLPPHLQQLLDQLRSREGRPALDLRSRM